MKRAAPWLLWTVLAGCAPATTAPVPPAEAAVEIAPPRATPTNPMASPILDGEAEREEEVITATAE